MRLIDDGNSIIPAVTVKKHDKAKAMLFTYTMGEAYMTIADHYFMLKALLQNTLGMSTRVQLSGSSSVTPFFYETSNDRAVLLLMSWDDYKSTTVTVTLDFLKGKSVKDLRKDRSLVTANSDGTLTVTLDQNESKLFLIGETASPSVGIDATKTSTYLIPSGRSVPITVNYDTIGNADSEITIELRQTSSNRVFAKSTKKVTGQGSTVIDLNVSTFSVSDVDYKSTSSNKQYYYLASITKASTQSRLSVLVEFLYPSLSTDAESTSLPSKLTANQASSVKMSWNYLPSFRFNSYRGLVVIYKSSKTAAVDATHNAKVDAMANLLKSIGYQQTTNMSPWDSMKNEEGPWYFIGFDDVPTYDGLKTLSAEFLTRRVKTLILPGVSVLNAEEVSGINAWLNAEDSYNVLITTERVEALSNVFGVKTSAAGALSGNSITITNATSPVLSYGDKKSITLSKSASGNAWSSVDRASALGTIGNTPVLIASRFGLGSTFAFNFDVTSLSADANVQKIMRGLDEYMTQSPFLYRLRVEALCGSNVVGFGDETVRSPYSLKYRPGSAEISITPSAGCDQPVYKAYLYPYYGEYAAMSLAQFSSDTVVNVETAGTHHCCTWYLFLLFAWCFFLP
ncbi:hypothetical protein AKO1_015074 [Acrasis kona]|uniref:Uncharacterized protein n=1 Tax=Acrasis kona TaxID=1008807 RepID=A0AAW2YR80_9EUKA